MKGFLSVGQKPCRAATILAASSAVTDVQQKGRHIVGWHNIAVTNFAAGEDFPEWEQTTRSLHPSTGQSQAELRENLSE